MTDWLPIDSAPRDGTPVRLRYRLAEDEPDWEVSIGFLRGDIWWVAWPHTDPPGWTYCHPEFWKPLDDEGAPAPYPPLSAAQHAAGKRRCPVCQRIVTLRTSKTTVGNRVPSHQRFDPFSDSGVQPCPGSGRLIP